VKGSSARQGGSLGDVKKRKEKRKPEGSKGGREIYQPGFSARRESQPVCPLSGVMGCPGPAKPQGRREGGVGAQGKKRLGIARKVAQNGGKTRPRQKLGGQKNQIRQEANIRAAKGGRGKETSDISRKGQAVKRRKRPGKRPGGGNLWGESSEV